MISDNLLVAGSLKVKDNDEPYVAGNRIAGDLQCEYNGLLVPYDNDVGGLFKCFP